VVLDGQDPQTRTLQITLAESGRQIERPLSREITIGRTDPASATFPDIDLAPEQGLEMGVSRRHARIVRQGGDLCLEDLGSANGTYLNGVLLAPHVPRVLSNHDEIRLGRALMRVHIH
jgi:pSer/pThr/pTyr-binding forkhead associated (FHA) protein